MLLALLWTLIWSISKVFFKKTTSYDISPELNDVMWFFSAFICIFILLFLWNFVVWLNTPLDYIFLGLCVAFIIPNIKLNQYVYKKEKISVLVPYQNITPIVTFFLALIFLWESLSIITMIIFFLVICILFFSQISSSTLVFNKNVLLFSLAQVLQACNNIFVAYILISNTSVAYFTSYIFLCFLVLLLMVLYQSTSITSLYSLDREYFIYRLISSLWWVSWLIGIIMISEFWIIISTLLWFFWLFITLASSYVLYQDTPTKRNIVITILISILVTVWFLFR